MSEPSYCTHCGNVGMAVVPHPTQVKNGIWIPARKNQVGKPIYVTAAVTCSCARGRKLNEKMTEKVKEKKLSCRKPLSLQRYRESILDEPFEAMREIFPNAAPSGIDDVNDIAKNLFEEVPY